MNPTKHPKHHGVFQNATGFQVEGARAIHSKGDDLVQVAKIAPLGAGRCEDEVWWF
jgi:hypothetical protein